MPTRAGDEEARKLTILYATETGNAQDVAERLSSYCKRLLLQTRVYSVDKFPLEEIVSEFLVVFVISTSGSGKEPRTMAPFWTMLLRSDLPGDLFEDLDFAVFGLGDSSYEKFCWPAKLLSRRLLSLGANEFCERGEGDEQHHLGVDGAFLPWLKKLSEGLVELYSLPAAQLLPVAGDAFPPPRVSLIDAIVTEPTEDPLSSDSTHHLATLSVNDRTTAEDWYQDVRHIEFDFEDSISYEPGDVAIIHPEVPASDVDPFLISMGYANTADDLFTIVHSQSDQSLPDHMPTTLTLRKLFTRYLDITAVPRRSFFSLLRYFTTDELEKEKLDEFLSEEGADDLYEYTTLVHRTIREVLEEFRSAKIPKEYLFDLFPPLRPREFSIACSNQKHPRKVQLCVAIVQYRTKLRIPRRGVTTTYLASLRPGDKVLVGIKAGGLIRLPEDTNTPIICIGPGTGIAPIRAIIEERILQGSSENTVYQGCRSTTKDHHYKSEFNAYADKGEITYRVACSRDGTPGTKRTYVQDLISQDSKRIWELIGLQDAWVVISGSSNKMPAGVRGALREAIQNHGRKTEEEARDILGVMEKEGKLLEDCWS